MAGSALWRRRINVDVSRVALPWLLLVERGVCGAPKPLSVSCRAEEVPLEGRGERVEANDDVRELDLDETLKLLFDACDVRDGVRGTADGPVPLVR